MPRYVYRDKAGHEHEETRAVEDRDRPAFCPHCRELMQRVVALVAPQFPGADRWR